jgi:6-phosphogluconolactonase
MRSLDIAGTQVVVVEDELAVSREAAKRIVDAVGMTLAARGEAHVALTGGSSAVAMHEVLSRPPFNTALDWTAVHFWWGDDRFVPRDHPESNAGMAYRTLFNVDAFSGESGEGAAGADVEAGDLPGLIVDADKVHPMPCEEAIARAEGPEWAAAAYAAEVTRMVPRSISGEPAFDLFLLGIGSDGHTLSVFPGSPGLAPDAPLVFGVPAPTHIEPYLRRVSFSTRVLPAATSVLVFTSGESKAEMLSHVLGKHREPEKWPAQAALLPNSVWLLDDAAASALPKD